ncbi:MAG TPA: hypothetical protein VJ023_14045 [Pyrinomonadaceae bacterium]|nr:hypothetical protein [Pyrinomonadaceae bacterium]
MTCQQADDARPLRVKLRVLVRLGKLHVIVVYEPQLGNDFGHQFAIVKYSYHRTFRNHDRQCIGHW